MSKNSEPINFINKYTSLIEKEEVYGEKWLKWIYESPIGLLSLKILIRRKLFSRLYGWLMNLPKSRRKIAPFIKKYNIDEREILEPVTSFKNFNQFFFRKLKAESRPLSQCNWVYPADGRHLWLPDLSRVDRVFAKGQSFNLEELLGDPVIADQYQKGSLLISRLCPVDYHRFHFPTDGSVEEVLNLTGDLYSVSPIALRKKLSYFWQNQRIRIAYQSNLAGLIQIIPIGATCVGGIFFTYRNRNNIKKGDEMGYFAFGGSTVITVFPENNLSVCPELLKANSLGYEFYARMGDHFAE